MMFSSATRLCNLYGTLGVSREASQQQLRLSYLRLAKVHHPDRHLHAHHAERSLAAERFKQIQNAWDVLGDPKKRLTYDAAQARKIAWPARSPSPTADEMQDNRWNEAFRARMEKAEQRRTQEEQKKAQQWYQAFGPQQSPHGSQHHRQPQDFQEVHRRQVENMLHGIKQDPNLRFFLGAGATMKLICQLGTILGLMLNLALLAWAKALKNKTSKGTASQKQSETHRILSKFFG